MPFKTHALTATGASAGSRGAEAIQPSRQKGSATGAAIPPPPVDDTTNRKNMALLIQLRWIAVGGQIVTIAFVQVWLGITLPLVPMAVVLCALVVLNVASLVWLRNRAEVSNRELLIALMLDVAALTAQLYLSGGATNPFTSLYLLQVTLGAVLLDARSTWSLVALTCASFAGLMVFYHPLQLPAETGDLFNLHIIGMFVGFALDATLLVVFVARITQNLRERDAHVAALRQHAAEEDHIVRMGLLASGAAHELGTPLASLSVILSDWRRMSALSSDPEMADDMEEMQSALQRCKSIVTGILVSAGEARGEASSATTVNNFLAELVAEWREARAVSTLSYENRFGTDLAIVSDTALKQVVFNVLDNAFEVSPSWVEFAAERDDEALVLRVSDNGPGFDSEMLMHLGKPYQSSKGRPGGGLGLFLVTNVVRKLGGSVTARNRLQGGATVTLILPLATLAIGGRGYAG
ncbi:ATP-binding protein [Pseudorhodoplanes sinuspersici]|uniref:histidine kinase n=1 Tax=Pseudorhodoplanes sinuspersici TaxID=1235591 RepID=A0A1W6ZQ79_9HYPH|nr:ATP-binding protein [Pseudorhodoplanes sinuspersici]ARP99260.1 histidine kinase [Pseudorhodoplanes sinuspersici]RKE69061.1 two-component system sensor histidine kinase RegB [Pseudorhodoplanes sinuspersici]